jgi:hypothetical protein
MANYFASYDLNGQKPTHKEMDDHLKKLGPCVHRVLETVWYLRSDKTEAEMYAYMDRILSSNDRSLVISASSSTWLNLLVPDNKVLECWERT